MNVAIYYWIVIKKPRSRRKYPIVVLGNDTNLPIGKHRGIPKDLTETWCFHYLYVRL